MSLFFTVLFVTLIVLGALMAWNEERISSQDPYDDDDKQAGANAPLSLLPGDIKYQSPNGKFRFYFPVTSSIVLSIVLTLVLRFFG